MLREWLTRLRFLILRKAPSDLDAELAFHLEEQARANVAAGMDAREARRQARIAFGGVEPAREQAYAARPGYRLEMLGQDVRYALRGFRRSPVFTVTVILTLMLGIGATTAVFSVVDRILFRSLPYAHADRLVSLGIVHSLETQEFVMGNFYSDWRANQRPFDAVTSESTGPSECDLTERSPAQLSCESVEGNLLPTLGVSPVLGRNFLPEESRAGGPNVALISYGLWLNRFALDQGILNKTINIDGQPVQVVGVLPKDFEMPRLENADVLYPFQMDDVADRKANGGYGSPRRIFARLKTGVTVEQAQQEMEPLFQASLKQIPADIRKQMHLMVRSLRDKQMQDVRVTAWVLFGAVLAVLLIACANVASLLMARGAARRRELAVRSVLGASRGRLVAQALTEAMLLALSGAGAGCLLAEGLLRLFVAIAPANVPYLSQVHLDLRIVGFAVLVSVLCGLLFGLAPAFEKPSSEMLVGRSGRNATRASLRQWLVVAQIAASMVLLTGAMLLVRSFWKLEHEQLGIRADRILTVSVTLGSYNYGTPQRRMVFFQELEKRLRFGPGVSDVALSDSVPPENFQLGGQRIEDIVVKGRPRPHEASGELVTFRRVSPDYFRTLNIPIVRGESFTDAERGSKEHFVILSNKLAGRLFPGQDALGQRMQMGSGDANPASYTVVGVAADVKNGGLTGEQLPEYYRLRRDQAEDWECCGHWGQTAVVILRSSLPAEALSPWIRTQAAAIDPAQSMDIATMRQRVSKLADGPRFQTLLVGFFAMTGLVLAVIGLYGVISFLVAQRTQEIGVRMALGATRSGILWLVCGRSLRLILWGTGVGLVAALTVSRVLGSLLYEVGSRDPLSFVAVTLVLIAVALMATLIPARSAARVDPMVALRCE
ncbi:ABC transporter permease [Edaphobacter modestus]|uniref:Putative permease n=1 Tax=Edaphobacter modestus TaxID=388466 RepID=A0A4Q7YE01_9BACT|nr:ABC transporter permease [Edaphobacter modestus]RZU35582.1 putative permease [Edaphobacter modestus]